MDRTHAQIAPMPQAMRAERKGNLDKASASRTSSFPPRLPSALPAASSCPFAPLPPCIPLPSPYLVIVTGLESMVVSTIMDLALGPNSRHRAVSDRHSRFLD